MPQHFWPLDSDHFSPRPPQTWLNVIGSMHDTDVRHVAGNGCPLMYSMMALLYISLCSEPQEHPQPVLVADGSCEEDDDIICVSD